MPRMAMHVTIAVVHDGVRNGVGSISGHRPNREKMAATIGKIASQVTTAILWRGGAGIRLNKPPGAPTADPRGFPRPHRNGRFTAPRRRSKRDGARNAARSGPDCAEVGARPKGRTPKVQDRQVAREGPGEPTRVDTEEGASLVPGPGSRRIPGLRPPLAVGRVVARSAGPEMPGEETAPAGPSDPASGTRRLRGASGAGARPPSSAFGPEEHPYHRPLGGPQTGFSRLREDP